MSIASSIREAAVLGSNGNAASFSGIADTALPARTLVYVKSDGKIAKADATIEGKEAIGFVTTAVAAGNSTTVKLSGNILSGLSGLVPGTTYYMSTSPGLIATTAQAAAYASGNVLLVVGLALNSTELLFRPSTPITL
jgi:hypothetical protein